MARTDRFSGVQQMVFRGFLTTKVLIGDTHIVLKSINSRELNSISDQCPVRGHDTYRDRFESLYLAYGLYMVDGENVLPNRPGNINELAEAMLEIPPNMRVALLHEILYLQRAQDQALKLLEAYSYRPDSRHAWRTYKGQRLNDPYLTGIAGTERLGLCSHQIAWAYLNEEEDTRISGEELWSFAKFVASSTNPKGVRKIDQKDKARLKRLKEERDKAIRGEKYDGPDRIEARSVKELRAQLQDDLDGKKDLHDRIIDAYETSIRQRREQRRLEHAQMVEERREQRQKELEGLTEEELAGSSGFVTILGPEQLQQHRDRQHEERLNFSRRMSDRRKGMAEQHSKDRQLALDDVRKMVDESEESGPPASLTLPTDEEGPVGPPDSAPRSVDSAPKRNPRLAGYEPAYQPPTARQGATPAAPPGAQHVGTREDGTEVYYSANPQVDGKAPEGWKQEKGLSGAGASDRLTRHTYGSPNQKRFKGPQKKGAGHTTHIEQAGESDFFSGGGTDFTDKPVKKK